MGTKRKTRAQLKLVRLVGELDKVFAGDTTGFREWRAKARPLVITLSPTHAAAFDQLLSDQAATPGEARAFLEGVIEVAPERPTRWQRFRIGAGRWWSDLGAIAKGLVAVAGFFGIGGPVLLSYVKCTDAGTTAPSPIALDASVPPNASNTYDKWIRDGRMHEKSRRLRDAVNAFQDALQIRRDDPTALGELAWVLWRQRDFERGFKVARQCLDVTPRASTCERRTGLCLVKAQCYYTLGRLLEDKKQTNEAISMYKESLAIRPNATVRAQLSRAQRKVKPKAVP